MELTEGAIIAERFRLTRMLGKGGMGEVWAAQHMSLDIPCAVKFIHAESAQKPEVRERFEREAKAAAQLRSPNVVQILDYGVCDTTPYIAMEYLQGEELAQRLRAVERLDPRQTFAIAVGVGKALSKAHRAGIVHRDLKPENIFLVPDEGTEVPKVLDFGVAKQTAQLDSNTRTGALLGTPYYMSPEQAQGTRAIDHRADLWSFAVVIYRCLTGQLPFQSHALGDLLIKIVTQPVPVPSQVAAGLPPQFDAWWAKASQRDPAHRFQSAKELVDALGMALGVTLPHSLGNTPMPGAEVPMAVRTVMAQPGELPPHYGDGRPPYDSQLSFDSQNPYQSHGQSHGQSQGGQTAGGLTNGSSVMGVATTAAQPAQGNKRALVAALAAILVLGGIGGFLLMGRSDAETEPPITDLASPAASEPATPSEPTAEPEETATPEADESKGDGDEPNGDDAEPATSASAAADTGKAPVPVPRAVPVPRPREVPDKPPTPTPTPKPSPKGDGYDPGF